MAVVLKIGELARKTGLSVRTLHHYDAIGLVSPSRRTPAGHRLYGKEEVERLQRVVSLRQVGLSLDEIRVCLTRPQYSLERVLELQVERLDEEIERRGRLRDLIRHVLERLRTAGAVSVDELTRTIEVTMDYGKHYTAEQLEQLERRGKEVGEERIAASQREWQELYEAYAAAMNEGLDPASERVQALARKSADLIAEFTGGDPGIYASLQKMYETEGPETVSQRHGMQMAPGLWEYMGKARAALQGDE